MAAIVKWVLAVALCLAPVTAAWAMGSDTEPSSPDYAQGVKAVKAGNYEAALPLLQKAVAEKPKNANAWNYIGYSNRKLKRFDKAMTAYRKALAIEPNHRGANEYIGELYLQMGALAKAKERLKVLDSACFFGCEEFDELKEAIAAFEKKKSGS
ncbi:MAG: tetratricopeptide repeat protein [Rhodospirillaceae bacterium]|jgi:Flp pilus assembly protein TadD|nr:tetratricopeptide repeat protein [Rhodospirillaceae bacterium]MBT5459770.1 tetratricopeptide repeat protein [Rhodospirillaceae bacterium]MBT7770938.1 tetratricopeptide repeat protein [Rhodospirillales bacterium]